MRTFHFLFVFAIAFIALGSCNAQPTTSGGQSGEEVKQVEVYYFHSSRRCAGCRLVEAESEKAVSELYGDKVPFASVNLEDEAGKVLAEKIGVNSQSLMIVSGDTKINITREGFMYSRDPEKLKSVIQEKVDPLL